jgi:hypothetical protein
MSDDIQEEWGGPHYDRGSGFTHHANDDCARGTKLPGREHRPCSRFQAHQPHNWGADSRCPGRLADVTHIARPRHEPTLDPGLFDHDLEPGTTRVTFGGVGTGETTIVGDPNVDEPKAETHPIDELTSWYIGQARSEIEQLTAKMVEYGGAGRAVDLIQIGQDLAAISGREVGDEEAAELGVYFYLRGKLSRWTAALLEGRRVSDDTLHDIGVYVRMAQRIRLKGGWPV